MQAEGYWSGTVFAWDPSLAWYFYAVLGNQGDDIQDERLFAVAVRPGDVAAAIPEPQTYALMLLGLGTLMVAVRKRPR